MSLDKRVVVFKNKSLNNSLSKQQYLEEHRTDRKEYLRITCRGVGLETHPRNVWDLFINVSVLMYRMFQLT